MLRVATATVLCIILCIMVQNASTQPTKSRDYGLLDLDSEDSFEDQTILDADQQRTNLGKLSSVMILIKNQFKEIIQELGLQGLQYLVYIFQHLKVKLLTKLGFYTLSDIFQAISDRITSFVTDYPTEMLYFPQHVKTTSEHAPVFHDSYWPLFRD